jgi:hypothetical protein
VVPEWCFPFFPSPHISRFQPTRFTKSLHGNPTYIDHKNRGWEWQEREEEICKPLKLSHTNTSSNEKLLPNPEPKKKEETEKSKEKEKETERA